MRPRIHPLDLAGYLGIPAVIALMVFAVLRLAMVFLESWPWMGFLLLRICLFPASWISPESCSESLVAIQALLVWGSMQTVFVLLLVARWFDR